MKLNWIGLALSQCHLLDWSPLELHSIQLDWIELDWIEFDSTALDSNESDRIELEWSGLSAVHWMLFCHGLVEFPIAEFRQVEIPTSDISLPMFR